MENRFTNGSTIISTTVWASQSATVGTPSGLVPPSLLLDFHTHDGGRKVASRRHSILEQHNPPFRCHRITFRDVISGSLAFIS